jgi:hypothetical protein
MLIFLCSACSLQNLPPPFHISFLYTFSRLPGIVTLPSPVASDIHTTFTTSFAYSLFVSPSRLAYRVSTEVTFWHSAEYGSDFRCNSGEIPRNSAEFLGISPELRRNHFRGQKIPRNSVSAEFRGHPTSIPYPSTFFAILAPVILHKN